MPSASESCCVATPGEQSRYRVQPIDLKLPGKRKQNLLLVPPERIVKVQIDVQAVDEELPVSRVNTHGLAEVLRE